VTRRIAFITGASRGIGAASAIALARAGFDVVVTARTVREGERHARGSRVGDRDDRPLPGSLETTARAIRAADREALAIRLDLLDRASILAAVDETETRWGPIDLLVNNGIYQGPGIMDHVLDLRIEDIERIYRGNVFSQLVLIQRVLPGMLERRRGALVNLVSASGMSDPPAPAGEGGWGFGYSSSKAAFQRLVGVLAVEHRDCGVRFHNLEPGLIITEMMKETGMNAEFEAHFRGAPPEVPAAVVAWLATDPAAAEWQGKTVFAQKLCAKLGLLPGWPPPRD
jgi:NAD(P)-dependent dehydrogenase (short-subunit alcohol dehydrogenase family)